MKGTHIIAIIDCYWIVLGMIGLYQQIPIYACEPFFYNGICNWLTVLSCACPSSEVSKHHVDRYWHLFWWISCLNMCTSMLLVINNVLQCVTWELNVFYFCLDKLIFHSCNSLILYNSLNFLWFFANWI